MKQRVLIAGCGDLGNAIGEQLIQLGLTVFGLRRNIDQLSKSIQPIAFDLSSKTVVPELPEVDYLVYSAAAKSRDIATYQQIYLDGPSRVLNALPNPPKRCFIISSTGVYAQNSHEWIDESSEAKPNNPFGQLMLEGEQALTNACQSTTIIRSSGIYGPGRNHLISRIKSGVIAPKEPEHFSNRIHRDDLARFAAHLIELDINHQEVEPLYLATDGNPTPIHEITTWLANSLGVTPSSQEPIQRGGSKRIKNEEMCRSGFKCRYPSYIEGFTALIQSELERANFK